MPTKEQFLSNPLGQPVDNADPTWVREGWQSERFRSDVTYILSRSLSKVGSFNLAAPFWLPALAASLSPQAAADLYVQLRDDSQRLELEWRPAFCGWFPAAVPLLPPSNDATYALEELEHIVASGDGRNLTALLDIAASLPEVVAALGPAAERARANGFNLIADMLAEFIAPGTGSAA